ncbi:MAG: hypothetical protein ABIB04_00985 [Patescibacteria group bacterium]
MTNQETQSKQKKITDEEYQKVVSESHAKDLKRMPYEMGLMIFFFFLLIVLAVLYFFTMATFTSDLNLKLHSLASKIFIPYLVIFGASTLIFFARIIINSLRCPKCRRFFPRGKLKLYDSFQRTAYTIDTGGDYYYREGTALVYWTRCKYCGQLLLVTKGG